MPRKTEGGVWKVEREFLGKFTTKELVEKVAKNRLIREVENEKEKKRGK